MDAAEPTATLTTIKTEQLPAPFWRGVLDDIHVNASGALGFVCALGIIWGPEDMQKKFTATAAAAGIYLFASAKAK